MDIKDEVQLYNKIDEDSKNIIDMIDDPEFKVKANKYLRQLYTDHKNNGSDKKLIMLSPKQLLEQYENMLLSEGKAGTTIYNYILRAKGFSHYLHAQETELYNLEITTVENYLADVRKKNPRANSYSKEVAALKSYLSFLYSRNYIALNPMEIKAPKKVETLREVLNKEDIVRVEGYLSSREEKFKLENLRDRLVFYFGIKCGLRRSEVINLDWENLNFETKKIKVVNSKGDKNRAIYFNDDLKEILFEYRKGTGFYKGAVIRGKCRKKITKASMQNLINRIYTEAGIYREGLCFHSLRHTYAEMLRKNNTDIHTISRLLGHSSLETTERYLHSNEEDLIKASTV